MAYRAISTIGLKDRVVMSGKPITTEEFKALSPESQEMLLRDEHVEEVPDEPVVDRAAKKPGVKGAVKR